MNSKYSPEEHREKTEMVLACYGHLNYKSIARVVGCNYQFVSRALQNAGKRKVCKSYSINNSIVKQ